MYKIFPFGKEVCQGYMLSLILFNICEEYIIFKPEEQQANKYQRQQNS